MLSWLRRQHVRPEEVEAEADALIRSLGMAAYSAVRRREHEASSDAPAKYWNHVALAVAHKTGKRIGLDTSTRMALNAFFAPDREPAAARKPQLCQGDEHKRTLLPQRLQHFRVQFVGAAADRGPTTLNEVEVQAADVPAAIIAAANLPWSPRLELRILDREGREVFGRQRADRR
jgi:hypothetical protein